MADGAEGSTAKAAADTASGADGVLGRLGELAWRALPAIGSAIGFVGFVAIIGGAIEWIRFNAANLPATQAVLAVPKQELVVIGALALGVFVIGATLAVVVVYLIDSDGNATPRTVRGLIAVGVIEMALTLFFIGHHCILKYAWIGLWLIVILFVAGYIVGLAMRDFRYRTKVRHARRRVFDAQRALALTVDVREAAGSDAGENEGKEQKEARAKAQGIAKSARSQFRRAIGEWKAAADRVVGLQVCATSRHRPDDLGVWLKYVEDLPGPVSDEDGPVPGVVEVEAALDEAERRLGHVYRAVGGQLIQGWADWKARRKEKKNSRQIDKEAIKDEKTIEARKAHREENDCKEGRWQVGVASVFAVTVIGTGFGFLLAEFSWVAILVIVVVLLTAMNVFVARATDKFPLYGVAVFFSVLLFGAGLTIARTLHEPKVQPVALLRKGSELGMCGVYITQTNDRVYVGRLNLPRYRRPGLIFWVPTSEAELVSVGQPESIAVPKESSAKRARDDRGSQSAFAGSAEHMLARLYKERAEEAAPVVKNKTISEVSERPVSAKQAKKVSGANVVKSTENSEVPPEKVRQKHHPPVKIYGKICTATQHVDP